MLYVNISSPYGNAARSGGSFLTVYHKYYPNNTAEFNGFLFIDESNPQVSQIQLIGFSPVTGVVRLPMSKSQTISITIDDAPANFEVEGCTAQIEGIGVKLISSTYNAGSHSATVLLEAMSNMSIGLKYGMLVFGYFRQMSCNSSCCANSSCHESSACGEAKTACFLLEYFDDTLPRISNKFKTSGCDLLCLYFLSLLLCAFVIC
jgi:hypothetical protein